MVAIDASPQERITIGEYASDGRVIQPCAKPHETRGTATTPGIILCLTYWFPREERGRIVSLFMTAVAAVISAPFSSLLLGLDGHAGPQDGGIQGIPAVLLSFLADRPKDAAWLSGEERYALK
jgi:MFS family permease